MLHFVSVPNGISTEQLKVKDKRVPKVPPHLFKLH